MLENEQMSGWVVLGQVGESVCGQEGRQADDDWSWDIRVSRLVIRL